MDRIGSGVRHGRPSGRHGARCQHNDAALECGHLGNRNSTALEKPLCYHAVASADGPGWNLARKRGCACGRRVRFDGNVEGALAHDELATASDGLAAQRWNTDSGGVGT